MPAVDHAGQWLRQLSWRVGMSANVLRQSAARMTTDDQREAVGEIVAGPAVGNIDAVSSAASERRC
jgi:hypothetical protein